MLIAQVLIHGFFGKPDETSVAVATVISTAAPSAADSRSLKDREERWFLQYADRGLYPTCKVADYSDQVLTLTADVDQWNEQSEQDKTLTKRGLWTQWVNDYAHHHPAYKGGGSFVLDIRDLTGTKLASYY